MKTLKTIFTALEKALSIYDRHQKTKYANQYNDLIEEISREEAKPIYDMGDGRRRDQNRLDHLYLKLELYLRKFLRHETKND